MKEIKYQKQKIREIVEVATKYLTDEDRDTGTIIFKAPTGSGKTYVVSQAMTQMVKENPSIAFSFIWISVNKLHEQSLNSLSRYFEDERLLECLTNTELNNNTIEQNEIMFINWESINKENSLFRVDNEQNWNLQTVVENTKDEGRTIVLLIDESHRNAKTDKSQELIEIISPRLVIEITATPKASVGNLIDIPLQAVIREGMIKKEIQINSTKQDQIKSNQDLLLSALHKRKQLKVAYQSLGRSINPLLLIQIPNKKASEMIIQPEDEIIEFLSTQDITIHNGRLALWLSEDKRNKEDIENNASPVEVLIFKEAVALGWDCPRASILFLQREWNSERFEFNIQTLGRIMRMPEQMHYEEKPELNVGYVYSASNAFSIVEELAKDYVSEQKMIIDSNLLSKDVKLKSEHIRRKRELTRLSGDFKKIFFDIALKNDLKNNIVVGIPRIRKTIGTGGHIEELDKEQKVSFEGQKEISLSGGELQSSYDTFIRQSVNPYEVSRSQNILKTTIRSWCRNELNIGDEEKIQKIVLAKQRNNTRFKQVIEEAKEQYGNLPTKQDERITNDNWVIPKEVNLFSNIEKVIPSRKSILKQEDENCLLVRREKNGVSELSKPEKEFIENLEKTDDYVQWWFKNGKSDAKYFSITYKKGDGHLYGFYPDFIVKTKKEIIIVEIKDDKDFKADNYYKLLSGKNYVSRIGSSQEDEVYFFILSPNSYFDFFNSLKLMTVNSFRSVYEDRLFRFIKSQQIQISEKIKNSEELSKAEEEYQELFAEYEKSLSQLKDEELKRELAELELDDARKIIEQYKSNIKTLSEQINLDKSGNETLQMKVSRPFNICVLGEVSDQALIRNELNKYFEKLGIMATDWNVDFFNNTKLGNTNLLRSLQKGQSKYSIIITGQIFHHSGKGNSKANIISELKNEKYIPHIVGAPPRDLLTPDKIKEAIHNYLTSETR